MNTFTELSLNSVYHFYASPLDDHHRFNLHFKTLTFGTEECALQNPAIYSSDRVVYIQMPENTIADVAIFDLMGRELIRQKTDGDIISRINVNAPTGYYLVRVVSNNQLITRKVFIQ